VQWEGCLGTRAGAVVTGLPRGEEVIMDGAGAAPSPAWANPAGVAGSAAKPVIELWNRLASRRASGEAVNATALDAIPETARRWLRHAVKPGAPAARSVLLKMNGRIKVGRWLPFEAVQVLSTDGFVWPPGPAGGRCRLRGSTGSATAKEKCAGSLAGASPSSARPA